MGDADMTREGNADDVLLAIGDRPQGKRATKKKSRNGSTAKKLPVVLGDESMAIIRRLDDSIPLNTPEWQKVEQLLMQILEFAPADLVSDTATAIAFYADDQARRGYILGAADSKEKVA